MMNVFLGKTINSIAISTQHRDLFSVLFLALGTTVPVFAVAEYNDPVFGQVEVGKRNAATFPIELPCHFIETFTNRGDTILESFNGTGTTILACEQLGRKCRACEISPGYVAVALQRYEDTTGKTPVLIAP